VEDKRWERAALKVEREALRRDEYLLSSSLKTTLSTPLKSYIAVRFAEEGGNTFGKGGEV